MTSLPRVLSDYPCRRWCFPCTGCFRCWINKPGECVLGGPSVDMARMAVASDLLVVTTPVIFRGYSYEIKKVLDRIVCSLLLPFLTRVDREFHHPARYPRLPEFVVVGTLRAPDAEAMSVYETLVGGNACNLHSRRPLSLSPATPARAGLLPSQTTCSPAPEWPKRGFRQSVPPSHGGNLRPGRRPGRWRDNP